MPFRSSPFFGGDPFAEIRRLQNDMSRPFTGLDAGAGAAGYPPVNLWAGEDRLAVTMEVPGVEPEALDISVHDDLLTVSGERAAPRAEAEGEGDGKGRGLAWHRRERAYGKFSRSVRLPFRVDANTVQARSRDGVLEVVLHRPEEDKPRKIRVKSS